MILTPGKLRHCRTRWVLNHSFVRRAACSIEKQLKGMKAGLILPLVFCFLIAGAQAARADDFHATLTTIAGNGSIGFDDAVSKSAAFVYPAGVTRGPDGTIYVTDAGAQRIRAIRNGRVTTIAGSGGLDGNGLWVQGGYRDGPALEAQFDTPGGIAVDALGRIFVSDSNNHCIRLIEGGQVSTYAGQARESGFADGTRLHAMFNTPLELALGPDGSLYVADFGNGIRKIDAAGNVTTLYRSKTAMGVSISPGAEHAIFIAQGTGVVWLLRGNTYLIPNSENRTSILRPFMDVGHPYMIAALDDNHAVYTDAWTGAIRYAEGYEWGLRPIVGDGGDDVLNGQAGFRDGPLSSAQVSDPVGIANGGRAGILIADAGNRRVRVIRGLNIRSAFEPGNSSLFPTTDPPSSALRIGVIGNSLVWTDAIWDDSFEGALEDKLQNRLGRRVWVEGIRMSAVSLPAALDYLDNVVAMTKRYDVVVLLMNHGYFVSDGNGFETLLQSRLPSTAQLLHKAGVRFFVAYLPMDWDLKWGELNPFGTAQRFAPDREINPYPVFSLPILLLPSYKRVLADLSRAGAPVMDLWPAFIAANKSSGHKPLFGTEDEHFSPAGRRLLGQTLASLLEPYLKP